MLAVLCVTTGCGFPVKEGRVYPIIGLGFIRVVREPTSPDRPDAVADRTDIHGAMLATTPAVKGLVIGHLHRQTLVVNPDADLLIDSASGKGGRLDVEVIRASREHPDGTKEKTDE